MTLTYPQGLLLAQSSFDLVRSVQTTALRGGGAVSIDYAPARWVATLKTPARLDRSSIDPIRALIQRLRGGLERIFMHDFLRAYPSAYPNGFAGLLKAGGGAFDGTADVTARNASTIALAGLPAAFSLHEGDMVGLVEGSTYGLFQLVGDTTADGSGVATVTVEPHIPLNVFTVAAVANFAKPACIMVLVDQQRAARDGIRETVEFSLVQVPF